MLWCFVPHCFVMLQHILIKPGKKDCQIFDASQKYNWDSILVNHMTSTPHGFKLHWNFGSIWEDNIICEYNLCMSYQHADIVIHANDIKSCFCQIRHHPDIVRAFLYALTKYLFFQVGLAFGASCSTSNWEAVRQIQLALAT